MQLHELKGEKKKKRKRVGRGGKRGTYSGRGMKGQKSRAGTRMQPVVRGLLKRYPKLKGYKFKANVLAKPAVINLEKIEKIKGLEIISPKILLEKGLIRRIKGRTPKVKVLAGGEITKKLIIEGCLVSKSAKEKIEKAGGKVS